MNNGGLYTGRIATIVFSGAFLLTSIMYVCAVWLPAVRNLGGVFIESHTLIAISLFLALSYSIGSLIRSLPTRLIDQMFLPHGVRFPYPKLLGKKLPKFSRKGSFKKCDLDRFSEMSEGDYKLMKSIVIQRSMRLAKHLEFYEENVRLIVGFTWASIISFIFLIILAVIAAIIDHTIPTHFTFALIGFCFVTFLVCGRSFLRSRLNEVTFTIFAFISVTEFFTPEIGLTE